MMNPFRAIGYSLWIGKEIVTGTVDVLTGIFKAGEYGRPMIVELPLRCETDVEITLMASSITITPGTLVVASAAADERSRATLFVHALFGESEADVLEGLYEMEDRLLHMTRGRKPESISSWTAVQRPSGDAGSPGESGTTGEAGSTERSAQ
ncbi:multicomponent Na+:H+ antiporter subunit E [Brevibacterium pityocampae]